MIYVLSIIALELGVALFLIINYTFGIIPNRKKEETPIMSKEDEDKFIKADKDATENFNSIISTLNAFMLDKEVDTSAERQDF